MLPVFDSSVGSDESELYESFVKPIDYDEAALLRFDDFLASFAAPAYLTGDFSAPAIKKRV